MATVIQVLNGNGLVPNLKNGTSVEILENMNKLNIIRNANITETYATELFLSMCLRSNENLNKFVQAFGATSEMNVTKFFDEFAKVRSKRDGEKGSENLSFDPEYYDVINSVLDNRHALVEKVRASMPMPTIADYLKVAEKENALAKRNHPELDDKINNESDIVGATLPEHAKFIKDNFKKQSIRVQKGFKVRLVMVKADDLTDAQIKLVRKFKNLKTTATARIVNKLGGKGYLCSPTKERQVTLFALDKRFFNREKGSKPQNLSLNSSLFYSIYDLNGRALKYKKSYIQNRLIEATGENAKSEDVKTIVEATKYLATRYMLFGLNLNNGTDFDPNVVFDYRAEKFFINEIKKVENPENNYILPIVQELASNMATEFFKNAEVAPEVIKGNLQSASKYLPEFNRSFDSNTYAGVLFNSSASTYNMGKVNSKAKRPHKHIANKKNFSFSAIKGKKKADNTKKQDDGLVNNPTINNSGNKKTASQESEKADGEKPVDEKKKETQNASQNANVIKDKPKVSTVESVKYTIFGEEKEFKVFTYEEYCENYANNILKPCSSMPGLEKAKEIYNQYMAIEDDSLTAKDKLEQVIGEDWIIKFYNNYVDYAEREADKRSKYCERILADVREQIIDRIADRHAEYTSTIMDGDNSLESRYAAARLFDLAKAVSDDLSLSNVKEFEPLIDIVVEATKDVSKENSIENAKEFLDIHCEKATGMKLNEYLTSIIEQYALLKGQDVIKAESTEDRLLDKSGVVIKKDEVSQGKSVEKGKNGVDGLADRDHAGVNGAERVEDVENPPMTNDQYNDIVRKEFVATAKRLQEEERQVYQEDNAEMASKINAEKFDEIIEEIESDKWLTMYDYASIKEETVELRRELNSHYATVGEAEIAVRDYFKNSTLVADRLNMMANEKRTRSGKDLKEPTQHEIDTVIQDWISAQQGKELTYDRAVKMIADIGQGVLSAEMDFALEYDSNKKMVHVPFRTQDGLVSHQWVKFDETSGAICDCVMNIGADYLDIKDLFTKEDLDELSKQRELTNVEEWIYENYKLQDKWLQKVKEAVAITDKTTNSSFADDQYAFVMIHKDEIIKDYQNALFGLVEKSVAKTMEAKKHADENRLAATNGEPSVVVETPASVDEKTTSEEPEIIEQDIEDDKNVKSIILDGSKRVIDMAELSQKAKKRNTINLLIKRNIYEVLVDEIQVRESGLDGRGNRGYYEKCLDAVKSLRNYYNSEEKNNYVLKGISKQGVETVKKSIDAYKDDIIDKMKADKEYQFLSVGELIAKYMNYEDLKEYVLKEIDVGSKNMELMVVDYYGLNIENPEMELKTGASSNISNKKKTRKPKKVEEPETVMTKALMCVEQPAVVEDEREQ